jgi:hypothetical protein
MAIAGLSLTFSFRWMLQLRLSLQLYKVEYLSSRITGHVFFCSPASIQPVPFSSFRNTSDGPFSVPIEATACGFCRLTWPKSCEVCIDISRSCPMCPRCLLHQFWIFVNSAIVAGLRHHRRIDKGGSLERVQFSQASSGAECCDHFPRVRCSCQAGWFALQHPLG